MDKPRVWIGGHEVNALSIDLNLPEPVADELTGDSIAALVPGRVEFSAHVRLTAAGRRMFFVARYGRWLRHTHN